MFAADLLLNLAAIRWYSRNITRVIQHVSVSSSGPIAEIYGKTDTFLNTLTYWLEALRNSFFLPISFILISLLCALAAAVYMIQRPIAPRHFTVCALVSFWQIIIVLIVFLISRSVVVMGLLVMRTIQKKYGIIFSRTSATTLRWTLTLIRFRRKMLILRQ